MGNMLILCKGPGTAESLAKHANTFFKDGDFETINDVRINDIIALVRLELGEDALLADSLRFGIA